jgi:hypothetical protein
MLWPLIVTGGCMLLGFLLLGLPGALFMEAAHPLLLRLNGQGIRGMGDRAWPTAILISLGWPLAITPAWLWMKSLTDSGWGHWGGTIGLSLAWGFLLALLCSRPGKR